MTTKLTAEKNARFTDTYAASAYCPAGTAAILYAPSEKFYTVGPTDTSSSLIGGKGVWRVAHDGHAMGRAGDVAVCWGCIKALLGSLVRP